MKEVSNMSIKTIKVIVSVIVLLFLFSHRIYANDSVDTVVIANSTLNTSCSEETETDTACSNSSATAISQSSYTQPHVTYSTHIQNSGWLSYVKDGEVSGSTGKSLRLESIRISLTDLSCSGGVEYSTHVQNTGWQDYVSDGTISGTTGKSLRLEAIKIILTGDAADQYDIYYRVHAQNFGWMGWAKNGAPAGTEGMSYRLEAIQIVIVEKGQSSSYDTINAYYKSSSGYYDGDSELLQVQYSTHVQNKGWLGHVYNGSISGTTGQGLRLESIKIQLINSPYSGSIEYSVHVQNNGWLDYVSDGSQAGTTGKSLRIEAIKIRLTDELTQNYNVYYRVHVQNIGWLNWALNNEKAGTSGLGYRLEGIQIVVIPKSEDAPGKTGKAYIEKGNVSSLKILMLGNSFMSENNLPDVISRYTGGTVDSVLSAGAYLRDFITESNSLCTTLNNLMSQNTYDYVVIHDYSNNPLLDNNDFNSSVKALVQKINENGAKTVLMQTWAYRPGDVFYSTSGYNYSSMANGLYNAYSNAATSNGALVAYVGQSFYNYSDTNSLYTSEGQHPSITGTNIAARVIMDTIFSDYIDK